MNQNSRFFRMNAAGEIEHIVVGLLVQFWLLSEGAGQILTDAERPLARLALDNVMQAWHDLADARSVPKHLPGGVPGSGMVDEQLMQVMDTLEEACTTLGAERVYQILYRPDHTSIH